MSARDLLRARRDSGKGLLASVALLGAVAACSSAADDPGAIGADDQRQLNAAAAMLDSNSVDANALDDHESSPHD